MSNYYEKNYKRLFSISKLKPEYFEDIPIVCRDIIYGFISDDLEHTIEIYKLLNVDEYIALCTSIDDLDNVLNIIRRLIIRNNFIYRSINNKCLTKEDFFYIIFNHYSLSFSTKFFQSLFENLFLLDNSLFTNISISKMNTRNIHRIFSECKDIEKLKKMNILDNHTLFIINECNIQEKRNNDLEILKNKHKDELYYEFTNIAITNIIKLYM